MYPTQFMQIFGSASCVQQLIIPERLNQIYIVAHRWKEEILSFPTMCHSSKSVTCIKFKGLSYDGSSTCERKIAVGINTISPKRQRYFPFRNSFLLSRSPIVSFGWPFTILVFISGPVKTVRDSLNPIKLDYSAAYLAS